MTGQPKIPCINKRGEKFAKHKYEGGLRCIRCENLASVQTLKLRLKKANENHN